MAQKVSIELVDDLDGSPGEETIQFTWEGKPLVIDVSKNNADKLRKAIDPYVAAARPTKQLRLLQPPLAAVELPRVQDVPT